MSEWKSQKLGDCAQLLSGGTPSKTNNDYWNGNIPWISAKDLKSFFIHDSQDHITPKAIQNGAKVAPINSILILIRGMTLHNDIPIGCPTREMAFNQDVKAIVANEELLITKYLAYWLLANKTQLMGLVESASHGTGRINTNDLKSLIIPCPELDEQRQISSLLENFDLKIENLCKQNETLEAIAQTLFKHWFVDFEFPNADGKPYKSSGGAMEPSELGDIPADWHVEPLDKVADFLNGLALQNYPVTDQKDFLPVIKIREMKAGVTANTDRASSDIPSQYIIDNGDVLFSWSGSLEIVVWCFGKGALNQHLFKVSSAGYPKWLYYFWTLDHLTNFRAIAKSKATTMGHIQRKHLSEALCSIPTESQLQIMDGTMCPIFDKTIQNKLHIQTLTQTRNVLLPKLMSGQIRMRR